MGRKARKKKAKQSVGELLNLALRRISAGDGKQALDLLKRARFKGATEEQTGTLFHKAYRLRAKALDNLGLDQQARAARKHAAKYRGAPSEVPPTPSTLLTLMKPLSDKERFALYGQYLRSNQPHFEAELELADSLVLKQCWEHLELLGASSQFRLDAQAFASALPQLDRGDWNGGCRLLGRVGRKSGFRDWKTFSVAMAAHVRGDPAVAAATLKRLRPAFPLRNSKKALSAAVRPRSKVPSGISPRLAQLFQLGQERLSSRVRALRAALATEDDWRIARAVTSLGGVAWPAAPQEMGLEIALSLQLAAGDGVISYDDYLAVLECCGAHSQIELRLERAAVRMIGRMGAGLLLVDDVELYLQRLPQEFAGKEERRIARSRILYRLGRKIRSVPDWSVDPEDFEAIGRMTGRPASPPPSVWPAAIALYEASVRVDPSNTDAHKSLIKLLRKSINVRRSRIVAACEAYAKAVPDEPEPWLALAEFRLSHNAYRKAQEALNQARKHGGNDERVLDLLAVTSVFAAHQNIRRGHLDAAGRDIRAAEDLSRPQTAGLVAAWSVLLHLARQKRRNWKSACGEQIDSGSPAVRAQALCLVLGAGESKSVKLAIKRVDRRRLRKMISNSVDAVCRECPQRLPALVSDLPVAFECLAPRDSVVSRLKSHWPKVLGAVPDSGMFRVFLAAFQQGAWKGLRKELPRRLPRARSREQSQVLLLYLATVRFLLREDRDGRRFQKLKDSVPAGSRSALRDAAERLADAIGAAFVPDLVAALHAFEFDHLDQAAGLF